MTSNRDRSTDNGNAQTPRKRGCQGSSTPRGGAKGRELISCARDETEGPFARVPAYTLQRIFSFLEDYDLALARMACRAFEVRIGALGREVRVPWNEAVERAAEVGNLEVLRFLVPRPLGLDTAARHRLGWTGAGDIYASGACRKAAAGGHLACLKYGLWAGLPGQGTHHAAAAAGQLECMAYLLREVGTEQNHEICEAAAKNGRASCLKHAISVGCLLGLSRGIALGWGRLDCFKAICELTNRPPCLADAQVAASGPDVRCLEWIHKSGVDMTAAVRDCALAVGNSPCFVYACENGAPAIDGDGRLMDIWSGAAYRREATSVIKLHTGTLAHVDSRLPGALDCLRYLHEHGVPWGPSIPDVAILGEGSGCFEYALENGCPVRADICERAFKARSMHYVKYTHENGFALPAVLDALGGGRQGITSLFCYPPIVRYLVENGCGWGSVACEHALGTESEDMIPFLRDRGCPWGPFFQAELVCRGALETAVYAHRMGAAPRHGLLQMAAAAGDLIALEYFHEAGYPWDPATCARAAEAGSLECLEYAHRRGAPLDHYTAERAARAGSASCLRYCLQAGARDQGRIRMLAALSGNVDCLKTAHEHGSFWSRGITHSVALTGSLECTLYAISIDAFMCANAPASAVRPLPEQEGPEAARRSRPVAVPAAHSAGQLAARIAAYVKVSFEQDLTGPPPPERPEGLLAQLARCYFALSALAHGAAPGSVA